MTVDHTGVNNGSFGNTITRPAATELVTGASIGLVAQDAADQDKYLYDSITTVRGQEFLAQENTSAKVYAAAGFSVVKDFTFGPTSVPTGGSGSTTSNLWTTPSVPFAIDQIVLLITGNATASGNPGSVEFKTYLGSIQVNVGDTSSWGGTTYTVDGTTVHPILFGLKTAEKSDLWTPPAGDETDDLGYGVDEITGAVIAAANGGSQGLWGKNFTVNIMHGAVGSVTLTIPLRLIVRGSFL